MEREKLMVIVVGIVLAVSIMQAFQLSDLVKNYQNVAQQVAAKNAQLAGALGGSGAAVSAPTAGAAPPGISAPTQVGGC